MALGKKTKFSSILIGISVIIMIALSSYILEDVDKDVVVVHKYPGASTLNVWSQGVHFQMFGSVDEFQLRFPYWFTSSVESGGAEDQSKKIIFNQGGQAKLSGSISLRMPRDEKHIKLIGKEFGNMKTLQAELVRETVNKVIFNTGPLMSAYESYAAKKTDLVKYIEDQLRYGVYKTTSKEVKVEDLLSGKSKVITQARPIANNNAPGGYERQEIAPFAIYGLEVVAVSLDDIEYSSIIDEQIKGQQKAKMAIQTAIAKAKEAEQEAIRAVAAGKASAASAKWAQEKIKATAVTRAQQDFEVAALDAKKALEVAKKIKAEKWAEAEANKALRAAGLTPQEEAEWNYKTRVGIAAELAKVNVPGIVVTGGSGTSGGTNPMNVIGVKMLMDINESLAKSKVTK